MVLAIIPKARFVGGQRRVRRRSRAETLKKSGPQASTEVPRQTEPLAPTTPVCIVTNDEHTQTYELGAEVPTEGLTTNESLYTRHKDAFKPERVQAVLDTVTIGPNITEDERGQVNDLIREFAGLFCTFSQRGNPSSRRGTPSQHPNQCKI